MDTCFGQALEVAAPAAPRLWWKMCGEDSKRPTNAGCQALAGSVQGSHEAAPAERRSLHDDGSRGRDAREITLDICFAQAPKVAAPAAPCLWWKLGEGGSQGPTSANGQTLAEFVQGSHEEEATAVHVYIVESRGLWHKGADLLLGSGGGFELQAEPIPAGLTE